MTKLTQHEHLKCWKRAASASQQPFTYGDGSSRDGRQGDWAVGSFDQHKQQQQLEYQQHQVCEGSYHHGSAHESMGAWVPPDGSGNHDDDDGNDDRGGGSRDPAASISRGQAAHGQGHQSRVSSMCYQLMLHETAAAAATTLPGALCGGSTLLAAAPSSSPSRLLLPSLVLHGLKQQADAASAGAALHALSAGWQPRLSSAAGVGLGTQAEAQQWLAVSACSDRQVANVVTERMQAVAPNR